MAQTVEAVRVERRVRDDGMVRVMVVVRDRDCVRQHDYLLPPVLARAAWDGLAAALAGGSYDPGEDVYCHAEATDERR